MENNIVLANFLKNVPTSKVLFKHKTGEITYGDLCSIKERNKAVLEELTGSRVVIIAESRLHFAILCYLLDGITNAILFLPSDISDDLHDNYISSANINYRVSLLDGNLVLNAYLPLDKGTDEINTRWIIPTSGTTSTPKLIEHGLKDLIKTTKMDTDVGSKFIWGLTYDIYRFAGVQVYLQALLGGAILIFPEEGDSISEMITLFVENKCNAISATPSYWRKLSMDPYFDDLSLNVISLGGEIVDQTILSFLSNRFPAAKITHIYASTEAGVGFHVSDKKAGFPLAYLNNEKYKAKINDEGALCFKNEHGDYVSTGDLVEINGDRVFFLGRDSGSINVGGNKVLPEEIEGVILKQNSVKEVRVYGMKNVFLGNLVCADIVLKNKEVQTIETKKEIQQEVLRICKNNLLGFKVPAKINFVENIEVTNSGKVKR